ncbi:MAG: GNAT family N-acetyltransferase [Alphaproteobacteria bacterium]|nr:GNAT family N-acetyltransferase [Alphaproteobacteria bacterium]MBP7758587.1 GNAT family N-acetyltransferase [Alphaproteobacteria bacterium]MBP7762019.1 GNAT family N-acetyltransferase [Alphaproteobacteria bacterium]MBP7904080.1 GNAT family N-acetyltransferase [Alphaproteobacteria bacterium]
MTAVYLRPLVPDDSDIFRSLRLQALSMHPGFYSGTLVDAQSRPPEEWREMLDGNGKQIFGLFDGETLIGITAVFTCRDDPSGRTGVFAMSFIEPAYRGKGYADLYYKARIDFGMKHLPWTRLSVSHRADNEPSKRAILRHGFTLIGQVEKDWPDGQRMEELMYEMDLVTLRKLRNVK